MPSRPWSRCPSCKRRHPGKGRCPACRARAEAQRGTAAQRGYGHEHSERFRRDVLDRDPVCTICHRAPATVADHHPYSRRELVERGLDPNDASFGRGLCKPCDSRQTAARQPGGFARHD